MPLQNKFHSDYEADYNKLKNEDTSKQKSVTCPLTDEYNFQNEMEVIGKIQLLLALHTGHPYMKLQNY